MAVGERCYVIGTLFKKTDLQGTVLRDICNKVRQPEATGDVYHRV